MGNLYTDNLIGTVIGLSVADDWEGARREWRIVGCEVDETHSATCVCGKEGLRYVYTIANTETGETLSPIGSSCIKKFEQSDMDEELAGWQQAIKLMEEAARIGKEDYVHLHSGSYSRKLLYFLYEQDAFRPTKYNGYDGYNDYHDKENPKIPDWYWNVWDDYDCWSNSLNGNEITYRFLRKRGCPAYLAKTIASK